MKIIIKRCKNFCFFIVLSLFLLGTEQNLSAAILVANNQFIQTAGGDVLKQGDYLIEIIAAAKDTYGYDVYKGKKLLIHQPTVPAVPRNTGFTTKAAAEKVARKVVEKMKKGEALPTVTVDELKEMNIIPKQ